jgi:hypothetical protein
MGKYWGLMPHVDPRSQRFLSCESTLNKGFPLELITWEEVCKSRRKEEAEEGCYDTIYRSDYSEMNQLKYVVSVLEYNTY